jgi:hypothetical protein
MVIQQWHQNLGLPVASYNVILPGQHFFLHCKSSTRSMPVAVGAQLPVMCNMILSYQLSISIAKTAQEARQ